MKQINNIREVLHGIGTITCTVINTAEKLYGRISNGLSQVSNLVETVEKQSGYLGHIFNHLECIEKESEIFNKHENVLAVMLIQESFMDEDAELIDICLDEIIGLKPNHEIRQALWWVTVKSKSWMRVEPERLINYLYVSVRNEARRIKRDREVVDSLWNRSENIFYQDHETMIARILSPEAAVLRAEERRIRFNIIKEVMNKGSSEEKKILKMILEGYTPAECVKKTGVKWSRYQGLQRKLGRKFKKVFYDKCLVT